MVICKAVPKYRDTSNRCTVPLPNPECCPARRVEAFSHSVNFFTSASASLTALPSTMYLSTNESSKQLVKKILEGSSSTLWTLNTSYGGSSTSSSSGKAESILINGSSYPSDNDKLTSVRFFLEVLCYFDITGG